MDAALYLTLMSGGSAFNPLSAFAAGDDGFFHDFTSLAGKYQDSSATTPVTQNTQPLGYVSDLSPNGNHGAQATTSAQPNINADRDVAGSFTSGYTCPDGLGSTAGKGVTCTGLALDPDGNNAWLGNEGRADVLDMSWTPSLIKMALATGAKDSEINLLTPYASNTSLQGVAYDESDDTFWLAFPVENRVEHMALAGTDVGDGFGVTGASGVCVYDGKVWVCTVANLYRYSKAGSLEATYAIPDAAVFEADQLTPDETRGVIWITGQADAGETYGGLAAFNPTTGRFVLARLLLGTSNAPEGAIVVGDTIYYASDEFFHSAPIALNQVHRYENDLDALLTTPGYGDFATNDYLPTGVAPGAEVTMVAAFRAGTSNVVMGGAASGNTSNAYLGLNASGYPAFGWGTNNYTVAQVSSGGSRAGDDIVVLVRANASTVEVWVDGVKGYDAAASGSGASAAAAFVGCFNANGTPSTYMTGRMYADLMVKRRIADSDVLPMMRDFRRRAVAAGASVDSF